MYTGNCLLIQVSIDSITVLDYKQPYIGQCLVLLGSVRIKLLYIFFNLFKTEGVYVTRVDVHFWCSTH